MSKLINLLGLKFGRLTVKSFENGKWNCLCDCGKEIRVFGSHINSGNSKSCGCFKIDNLKSRVHKLIDGKRKYSPRIASARRVWKNTYCYRDTNCMNFDDFYKISQMNCFYCGIEPSNKYNYFIATSARGSIIAKRDGEFIYNGLDRIDSSKYHTIDNVVPACMICNRSKNDRSINEFLFWINNLKTSSFQPINIIKKPFPIGSLATSIKCVFYNHKNDTDMTVDEYYSISQMNCFYCNILPNNIFNRAKTDKKSSVQAKETGNYIYNGIDRINTNYPHNKNNVVPCCCWCNWAKNKLALPKFQAWIKRVQKFQLTKISRL